MTPKNDAALKLEDAIEVALHDQIKWRAYELYERQGDAEGHDSKTELGSELLNVVYAAWQVQKCSDGEVDSKTVRAAQAYLRALISYIGRT